MHHIFMKDKKSQTSEQSMTVECMKITIKSDKNKKEIVCYDCDKPSHYKSQCSDLIKNTNCVTLSEIKSKRKDQHSQKSQQT